jgi:hypothetical protein
MAVRRAASALFVTVCATLLVLALSACSFSTSTANISDAKMATDKDGKNPTKTFSPDDTFYCLARLNNAPEDTTVRAVWTAVKVEGAKPNTKIDEAEAKGGSSQLQFNLTNNDPWATGKYEVQLYLNDAKKPTKTLSFEVRGGGDSAKKDESPAAEGTSKDEPAKKDEPPAAKTSASTASLSDVRMATDGDGKHPTVVFSPKDTFYCVGNLENAPDNTTVTTLWIASDVDGLKPNTKLKQISDKGGSGPFQFELSADGPWPKGKYVVALYLNDANKPTKALAFEVR